MFDDSEDKCSPRLESHESILDDPISVANTTATTTTTTTTTANTKTETNNWKLLTTYLLDHRYIIVLLNIRLNLIVNFTPKNEQIDISKYLLKLGISKLKEIPQMFFVVWCKKKNILEKNHFGSFLTYFYYKEFR